jgi:hypothetical protein
VTQISGAGRTDPAQFLRTGEEFGRHGPVGGIGVSMSATTSLGSAYALGTAPGTAWPIFSGQDGSASCDSNRIVKLIGKLQLVHMSAGSGSCECRATTPPSASSVAGDKPAEPVPQLRPTGSSKLSPKPTASRPPAALSRIAARRARPALPGPTATRPSPRGHHRDEALPVAVALPQCRQLSPAPMSTVLVPAKAM